jgi:TM2 domain-containing membrane protein YozV
MGEFVFISETLDNQIAEAFPRDVQIDAMASKVADLERKLKKKDQVSRMKKVGSKYVNMETAYKKSWIFPGQGHFYSGQTGKGFLFSGLEIASLAGIGVFASTYSSNVDMYTTAQSDYEQLKADLSNGIAVTQSDIQTAAQAVADASSAQNQALYSLGNFVFEVGFFISRTFHHQIAAAETPLPNILYNA